MAGLPKTLSSRFPWLLVLALGPACSGEGCGGGCNGVTPLPGGFVNEERVENAAAVRVSEDGVNFLENNLPSIASNLLGEADGVLTFNIDSISGSAGPLNYTVCPSGPDPNANPPRCVAEINISGMDVTLNPQQPHNLSVTAQIPIRVQDLPVETSVCDFTISMTGNGDCPGGTFADVEATVLISIETDRTPTHARYGYTRVVIEDLSVVQSDITNAVEFCDGWCESIISIDFIKEFLVDQLYGGLRDTIQGTLEDQLCQAANPALDPPCPTGTNDVDGVCRYGTNGDADCVPIALGSDGHADLSGLLSSISPGTKGGLDFLIAAGGPSTRDDGSGQTWGDLNPINGGISLSAFGGVEPNPLSKCVPLAELVRPTGLQIPNELIDESLITNWPGGGAPHIGIGISESFTNYALAGLYNSGMFCIGLSTEQVDLLNSGTVGLLAQSLRDLGIQRETQPIAIAIKPSQPPNVTFGNGTNISTDPMVRLVLPAAGFDFFIFSSDRYIRFMTATFDIEAPINITVTPEGLQPVMEELLIQNGKINNSQLLKEDPTGLAASLQSLLQNQVGGLIGGGLPVVDINGALADLGLQLNIPETVEGQGSPGLRTLVKNNERFLTILADLSLAGATAQSNVVETEAELDDVKIDVAGLRGGTITKDNAPELTLSVNSTNADGELMEHQVRIDEGVWRPWTTKRNIRIKSDQLRVEGKHTVRVRSRLAGQGYTVDPTPEEFEVLIDTLPPVTKISAVDEDGEVKLSVDDMVAGDAARVRYRFDDGGFSDWITVAELDDIVVPEGARTIFVEAEDENGNVGTAQQELIRGLPRGDSGCSCDVAGDTERSSSWPIGLLAMAAIGALLRKKSAKKEQQKKAGRSVGGVILSSASNQLVAAAVVLGIAGTYSGCSCDDSTPDDDDGPDYVCEAPDCVTLEPGIIGSYTSVAVDKSGRVWVAGYAEANYDSAFPSWGDLIVGTVKEGSVDWESVDGVPADPPPDPKAFNVEGFRGGQTAPGEDVGTWTSIAVNPVTDQPSVAYYDRTNKNLKFATFNGSSWAIETVVTKSTPEADYGKYAKLIFDAATPTIAFFALEPSSDGFVKSGIKLARGGSSAWAVEDVVVNTTTPCRAGLCTGGTLCAADAGVCAATTSGCAPCGDGEECLSINGASTCGAVLKTPKVEAYPMAAGLYIAVAQIPGGGIGIAYYDRVDGTLNVAAKDGEMWTTRVVDGGPQPDGSYGDAGLGASLAIDDGGVWHLSYIDGYAEALRYARVNGGNVEVREEVDAGFDVDGVNHPDGQHIVGDDSNIYISSQGEIFITYQDASNGTLRLATGSPNASGGNDWFLDVIASDAFGGYFSHQFDSGGSHQIAHWWRKLQESEGVLKGVGNVSVVSP